MNPDTKNLIAAICLSMSVLIGYQMLFGKPPEEQSKINQKNELSEKRSESSIDLPKDEKTSITSTKIKKIRNVPRIIIRKKELIMKNHISFNLGGVHQME